MTERKIEDYRDIIHLPHHVSNHRPHISMTDRAAQFSPFAALTGYDAAVKETERMTERRIEIDEDAKQKLSDQLALLQSGLHASPAVEITYFVPDERKTGGKYITVTGTVKKLNEYQKLIIMTDGTKIPIEEIIKMSGSIFRSTDDSFT